ncbi:hypothetical protein [Henriciella litoralis]|uniref:hypothetical protein n=1 Tax=Henriciella litoralis TaxID=568102 RepID=UPI0009FEF131|nr:hypothetical protein [Henriciella litoralis]
MAELKMRNGLMRREVLGGLAIAGAGMALLGACGGSGEAALSCAAPDQLTPSQKSARDGRKYVEVSKVDGKDCANCTFFKSPGSGCGTCGIDNLAANPSGYCTSWVAQESAAINTNRAEG